MLAAPDQSSVPSDSLLSFLAEGRGTETSAPTLRELAAHVAQPLASEPPLLAAVAGVDEAAGLRAADGAQLGDLGVLDYAVHSAPNVRNACELLARYLCLLAPGLEGRCERHGDRVLIHAQPRTPLTAAAEDALLASLYGLHVSKFAPDPSELECWFTHRQPADASAYGRVFGPVTCRFNAPCSGFVLSLHALDAQRSGHDPRLHRVVCQLAEILLAAVPRASSFSERIRPILARELGNGPLTCQRVARLLRMSPRTVARKLEAEGSTFYEQVDEVRKQAALRALARPGVALCELSFSLGFAHVASFHRAFKRWTGETPAGYRRQVPGGETAQVTPEA